VDISLVKVEKGTDNWRSGFNSLPLLLTELRHQFWSLTSFFFPRSWHDSSFDWTWTRTSFHPLQNQWNKRTWVQMDSVFLCSWKIKGAPKTGSCFFESFHKAKSWKHALFCRHIRKHSCLLLSNYTLFIHRFHRRNSQGKALKHGKKWKLPQIQQQRQKKSKPKQYFIYSVHLWIPRQEFKNVLDANAIAHCTSPSMFRGSGFECEPQVQDALKDLVSGGQNYVHIVHFWFFSPLLIAIVQTLVLDKENFALVKRDNIAPMNIHQQIPINHSGFHFYRFDHEHQGKKNPPSVSSALFVRTLIYHIKFLFSIALMALVAQRRAMWGNAWCSLPRKKQQRSCWNNSQHTQQWKYIWILFDMMLIAFSSRWMDLPTLMLMRFSWSCILFHFLHRKKLFLENQSQQERGQRDWSEANFTDWEFKFLSFFLNKKLQWALIPLLIFTYTSIHSMKYHTKNSFLHEWLSWIRFQRNIWKLFFPTTLGMDNTSLCSNGTSHNQDHSMVLKSQ